MSPCVQAGPAYAGAFAALHAAVFAHAPWNENAFSSLLHQPNVIALLHEETGFLLLQVVMDEAEILTFGTTHKRQGIGAQLLRAGLERLAEAGVTRLFLEVASRNHEAQAFYKKFNFVVTGRRKAYYEDGDDALIMCLLCSSSGDS